MNEVYAKEFEKYLDECKLIKDIDKSLIGEGKYICNVLDFSMYKIPATSKRYLFIQLRILDTIGSCYNFAEEIVFWKWELTLNNYESINLVLRNIDIPVRSPGVVLRWENKNSPYEDLIVYIDKNKHEHPQIGLIPGAFRLRQYLDNDVEPSPF